MDVGERPGFVQSIELPDSWGVVFSKHDGHSRRTTFEVLCCKWQALLRGEHSSRSVAGHTGGKAR